MSEKNNKTRILRHLSRAKKPLSAEMLFSELRMNQSERSRILLTLQQMETAGELVRNKKGRYLLSDTAGCVKGRVISLNKGFAFAHLEDKNEDCFIAGRYIGDALPGDTVYIRVGAADVRGTQGTVTKIACEGARVYTGRLVLDGRDQYFVEPDGGFRFSLPVRRSSVGDGKPGDKVRFTVSLNRDGDWIARIMTIYGTADSARVCADAIVDSRGIPSQFPESVLALAESICVTGVTEADLCDREDFRDRLVFTVDGADAKDLDDAISLTPIAEGWELGVHIADVSHYVRTDSLLDKEAALRGTSVYFADRVIPMLPEAISNGICSLGAGEDKLTLSCLILLDKQGVPFSARITKSVICSVVRGVYSEINALFANVATPEILQKYAPVMTALGHMRALATQLRHQAEERGTMDLISVETRFVLDEKGIPIALLPRETGEAEGMIEQFMIAANVAVATEARKKKLPFVYRVHEHPDGEKLEALFEMARLLGLKVPLRTDEIPQMALRELMEEARDTPYARLVSERLLRSMAKAQYSDNPLGHYGLALTDYCHFTSPIRRYPDLMVHRILTDLLTHTPKATLHARYAGVVRGAADSATQCEIRAMTAERDCEGCYKAEYMRSHLGESFTGIVVSLSDYGLYVELPNTVTGMVRLESLVGELHFDNMASLVDTNGHAMYTIGQSLTVCVAACEVSLGRITFVLE